MNILCPVCKKKLQKTGNSYQCENRHCFDLAKEGYLNLNLHNSQNTGDNQEMIRARKNFLHQGYYSFLRDEINGMLNEDDALIDLACGEGYYTSWFKCQDKIGIDLSKTGLKYAAKHDKSTLYLLNSIFHNPLEDECADKVLTIFAPLAKQEIVRLLKKDGVFIMVRPDRDHLIELKQLIYEHPYRNETEEIQIDGLKLISEIPIRRKEKVVGQDIADLFMMTPYYNTTSQKDKDKLQTADELEISFSFLIDIYRKE
ncbi:MAG: methyltransferase domain-containing protein [Erysipelotrichaceae bacterium]|nr:methyltransferase domain-containing protein [Erysipelotrichaceae bacterium]